MGVARVWHRQGDRGHQAGGRLAQDRMIERLARKLFTAEVMGILLIITGLQIFVYGISASLRNTDTAYFSRVSLVALALAWGLGKRNSKLIPAAAGMVVLGASSVWIISTRLFIPLIHFLRAAFESIPQVLSFVVSWIIQLFPAVERSTPYPVDTSVLNQSWLLITEPSSALATRFQTWFVGWQNHVTINDALVHNTIWLFLLWLFAAWIGWFAAQRRAIMALLPSLILLALVTSYSAYKAETICGMVVILLLLMGVWNYKRNLQQWQQHQVDYAESITFDNAQAILVVALTIGTLAFITPSVSWREIREALRERQGSQNAVVDVLGLQQKPGASNPVVTPAPVLPRDYLLGGKVADSEKIVMTIRTGELPPLPPQAVTISAPRYYWRSVVYNDYVGSGWLTTVYYDQKYAANTPLVPGLLQGYKALHLDVQMEEPTGQLFWSGTLFSADVPTTVEWRIKPTTDLFADQSTLLQADVFTVATRAAKYHVESYVPEASIETLRAASTDYPDQIKKQYLELPSSVPQRVLDLAKQITADQTTSYDQAKAIETYLRTNYPYDLNVPAPPPDQDVADYFLFDLKRGYCDYYATAMVVLARASGIPARFVSGYASGEYDAPDAQYIIRELNAHSWAEVYFPDIGWIEFEPTASQPEIDRTLSEIAIPQNPGEDQSALQVLSRFRLERTLVWAAPLLAAVAFIAIYFAFMERWLYMRLDPVTAISKIQQSFYRAGRPLAGKWTPAETSNEFLNKLIDTVNSIKHGSRFTRLTESLINNAGTLTTIYHTTLFINHQTQKEDVHNAWQTWRPLRRQLWLIKLWMFIERYRV